LGDSGDTGLLVMDNKEQMNLTQPFIDFCLILSTGGKRGRSTQDGTLRTARHRPVGLITTIEGVCKPELQARCVTIEYAVKGDFVVGLLLKNEFCASDTGLLRRWFKSFSCSWS
jgi:hypothetical protein